MNPNQFLSSPPVIPFPYLEAIVENVQNSLNHQLRDLIDASKLKNLVSIYSILMQHQHNKINSYLDAQQTLRPPSYNSLTRQQQQQQQQNNSNAEMSATTPFGSQYQNGFTTNVDSSELLQETISMIQKNVCIVIHFPCF